MVSSWSASESGEPISNEPAGMRTIPSGAGGVSDAAGAALTLAAAVGRTAAGALALSDGAGELATSARAVELAVGVLFVVV